MSNKKEIPAQHRVSAANRDADIIAAIQMAGTIRYYWRRYDWPKPGEANQSAWVIPNDIAAKRSSRNNQAIVKRLKAMAHAGILEMRHTSKVYLSGPLNTEQKRRYGNGMPRFRVRLRT